MPVLESKIGTYMPIAYVISSVASSMIKSSIERARACSKMKIRVLRRVGHA